MKSYHYICILLLSCAAIPPLHAQEIVKTPQGDSTIVFGHLEPAPAGTDQRNAFTSALGVDLLVSTNGFGLGVFYRHEYTDDFSGYIDFSISEAKDDEEVEFFDPYYGTSFTPGKVNRFLVMPLFVGIQQRLFADDIIDNFRPYVNVAAGPAMIYVFPYNLEYFNALGKGQPKYTFGGYIGAGAYFGSERSSLLGLNIRYSYIPYPAGLESMSRTTSTGTYTVTKKQFGSLSISLSFGTSW